MVSPISACDKVIRPPPPRPCRTRASASISTLTDDGAHERAGEEHPQRHEHDALAAVDVAQLAVNRSGDGAGHEVGDHHPRHPLHAAERGGNRRQGRGDDRLVHHRQEHRQHHGGEDGEEQPPGRRFWFLGVLHAQCPREGAQSNGAHARRRPQLRIGDMRARPIRPDETSPHLARRRPHASAGCAAPRALARSRLCRLRMRRISRSAAISPA